MRIQYLFDRPLPATETDSEQVLQTVAALARHGHELELVVPESPERPVDADQLREHYRVRGAFTVRGLALPNTHQPPFRKLAFAAKATTLSHRADLVYTRNLPVLFGLTRARARFVYETYRPWFDQFSALGPPLRSALRSKRAIATVLHSRYASRRYAHLGVPEDKLLVAHNGYDPSLLSLAPAQQEARRALRLPESAKVVTYTGHVNATKGIDSIVSLARQLPHVTFLIVGWDGRFGLANLLAHNVHNVTFVPWQPFDRVAWYLKASDVLLLPPRARGFRLVGNTVLPIKLFQYLAAGRPILAPVTADTAELLIDNHNARLFPEGDIGKARAALQELLTDAALADRLARGARATSNTLTWDARAKKLSEFLEHRLAASA